MMVRCSLIPLTLLAIFPWLTQPAESNTVATPEMGWSMDLSHDARQWMTATSSGNEDSLLMETLPESHAIESWTEMITNIFVLGATVNGYVDLWRARLAASGAIIIFDRETPDGSRFARYSSTEESGVWKFSQGPDGVYGVSYQMRPTAAQAAIPAGWAQAVALSLLIENPAPTAP